MGTDTCAADAIAGKATKRKATIAAPAPNKVPKQPRSTAPETSHGERKNAGARKQEKRDDGNQYDGDRRTSGKHGEDNRDDSKKQRN